MMGALWHICYSDLDSLLTCAQNVVGMSVVGPDFEKLKRFNLEELRQIPAAEHAPSSKPVKTNNGEEEKSQTI
jgi:hypothetical protein